MTTARSAALVDALHGAIPIIGGDFGFLTGTVEFHRLTKKPIIDATTRSFQANLEPSLWKERQRQFEKV